jgi:histidinol phosphatase-like PHP family hydrolase
MRIDLHMHTLQSDGELLPIELARRAVVMKHEAIAITDHADPTDIDRLIKETRRTSPWPKSWGAGHAGGSS